jgi:hypothetical protein
MRIQRTFLLSIMVSLLLVMAGCPGLYDSKRRKIAFHNYYEAPNEITRAAFQEAKRLDGKRILVCELTMAALFGLAAYVYVRTKGRTLNCSHS